MKGKDTQPISDLMDESIDKLNQIKNQKAMEILIFKDKMWNEIPEQDNPAFDYIGENGTRKQECLLITRALPYKQKIVGQLGYCVIHIPLEGDVINRGLFWNLKDSEVFAEAIQ